MQPWIWVAPASTAARVLATARSPSLWVWMPMTPSKRRRTSATISTRRRVTVPPLVSQRQRTSAPALCGLQGAEGVIGVGDVAIKEMLVVVDHLLAMVLDIADGFGDEDEVLVIGDAEGAFDVEVPGLAEDGDDGGAGFDERADVAVLMHGVLGEAGAAEGSQLGVVQGEFGRALEELLVFGVAEPT